MQTKLVSVNLHITNQHEKIACSMCGEMVGHSFMPRHIQFKHTASIDRQWKCTICGKGFAKNQILKDHMNIHTGEKPYMCKFCGIAFASHGNHRMHERTVHLGHKRSQDSSNVVENTVIYPTHTV